MGTNMEDGDFLDMMLCMDVDNWRLIRITLFSQHFYPPFLNPEWLDSR